jgi:hypothetical protein
MHTPAAAFTWQLWRRHRRQLIGICVILFVFAVIYPKLCAAFGFHPQAPNALDEMAAKLSPNIGGSRLGQIFTNLYIVFLAFAPTGLMVMSLLYMVWIFNFTEIDQKIKNPMAFPLRLFNLPVSTGYLFGWLLLGGMVSVSMVYAGWIYLVPLPHLEMNYQNWFTWMTMLVTTQAIVWSLAAWPLTRGLILFGIFFALITSPGWLSPHNSPFVFAPLFILGVWLGAAGLRKMRHGQWQRWAWGNPFAALGVRAKLRGPARFASPAQAQLWFEWRQFARGLVLFVAFLTLVPVAGILLWRWTRVSALLEIATFIGSSRDKPILPALSAPVEISTLIGFTFFLLAAPAILHSAFGMSMVRKDMPFLLVRPMTEGQMVSAMWKSSAISTALSWAIVLLALCAMPLLGDFHAVIQSQSDLPFGKTACVLGFVFLTWRFAVVDLCFVLTGHQKWATTPVWIIAAGGYGIFMLVLLQKNGVYWNAFVKMVPALLGGLVIAKILLAIVSFRLSFKRRLLAPSTMLAYLGIWLLLVAALLVLFHPDKKEFVTPVSLWILLLVPLARIGFTPIALAWQRHSESK